MVESEIAPSVQHSTVPSDPVARRAFLQSRVQLYVAVALALWGVAWLFERGISGASGDGSEVRSGVHMLALALLGVFYGLLRMRGLTVLALHAIEASASVLQAILGALLVSQLPLAVRPEMMAVFAATLILMVRASLIPGKVPAALLLGTATMLPSLLLTHWLYSTRPHVPEGLERATALAYITEWAVIALFATTTVQAVIYGLRARVLELGQYTLQAKIGEGGMGVVYRARHVLLRRPTAVKVLPIARMNTTGIARFEREVQLTAELAHPNIVSVYDFGRAADGSFYYAMEFVDGVDLQRLVEDSGPVHSARAVHILKQAADALAEAHAVELIHRDIKPANLLLSNPKRRPDHLTVLDFGLARTFGASDATLSDVRTITGSPLYMSPESIVDAAGVDARSDLYALGAVGYWLLTGTPPFQGKTVVEVCASHLYQTLELPSARLGRAIDPELEQLIVDCLAKDREARPASAASLLERLQRLTSATWSPEHARVWWSERAPRKVDSSADLALTRTLAIASRSHDEP